MNVPHVRRRRIRARKRRQHENMLDRTERTLIGPRIFMGVDYARGDSEATYAVYARAVASSNFAVASSCLPTVFFRTYP